ASLEHPRDKAARAHLLLVKPEYLCALGAEHARDCLRRRSSGGDLSPGVVPRERAENIVGLAYRSLYGLCRLSRRGSRTFRQQFFNPSRGRPRRLRDRRDELPDLPAHTRERIEKAKVRRGEPRRDTPDAHTETFRQRHLAASLKSGARNAL